MGFWNNIWDDVQAAGVAGWTGMIAGAPFGPAGMLIGAAAGASIGLIGEGVAQASASAADQAAQQAYEQNAAINQTAQTDAYKLAQETADINALQTNQANQLAQFTANQQTAETAESEQENAAYTSAYTSIGTAEQQVGSEQAQAAAGASNIISSAAARGIRVGAGAVQGASQAGQGSQITATQGTAGQAATAGVAATGAVTGAAATPGAAAVAGVDGAPSLAAVPGVSALAPIAATSQKLVGPAQAATPMQLAVQQGDQNIYDSSNSPLVQLAAYERNANLTIGNEQQNIVTAGNANLTGIADQAANFETNAAQNLLGEQTQQNQELQAAQQQLATNQGLSALGEGFQYQQAQASQAFTSTNLAAYDSTLWLSAFSNILSDATQAFSGLYKPPTYQEPEATMFEGVNGYADLNFGNYYSPGG
jgi:hypothetical protein